jgi:2-polyprenyl-6-methoxyphenol hydroxylase-like FAD-dependent oxidoreductase
VNRLRSDVKDATFKTIRTLKLSDHERFGYNSLRIERDDITRALAAAALDRGVSIYYSHKLVDVREDGSGVHIEFDNGLVASAQILVGSDGIWSRVRRTCFPRAPGPSYTGQTSFTWIVPRSSLCFPPGETLEVGSNSVMMTPQGAALIIADSSDGQRIRIALQRPLAELDVEGLRALREDKVAVLEILSGRDDNMPEPVKSAIAFAAHESSELFLWPFYKLYISSGWVSEANSGSVVILGDAAHAFPPAGGQGAGMAIEDAAGLGLILGRLPEFENIKEALGVWQKIRRDRLDRVSEYVATIENAKSGRPAAPSSDRKDTGNVKSVVDVSAMGWLYNWKFEEELDKWMETRERTAS